MSSRPPLWQDLRLAVVVAVAGGWLWGVCFGIEARSLLSWVALAPVALLLAQPGARRRWWLGWLHGTVYWLTSIPWIAYTLELFGGLPRPLALVLLLALALFLGLYQAVFVAAGGLLWRRGGVLGRLGLPALWVTLEWLRGYLFTGFPWNLAAYSWTEVPGALPLSAWIGAFGVSFLVVLANLEAARAVARRRPERLAVAWLVPLLLLALGGRWGDGASSARVTEPAAVRILQPAIPTRPQFDWQLVRQDYASLLELSEQACSAGGPLLVWPESAGWPRVYGGAEAWDAELRRDLAALVAAGCPVLFNSPHPSAGAGSADYNSAFLIDTEGELQRYDKRHLVPWGEYVPLARWLPFVGTLARNAGNFAAAEELSLLAWRGQRLGLAVCYEAIFPAEVAATVAAGATALVTVSNDAWYGDSAAPRQHFRAAQFRAAENRRPMLRAAITGISGLIRPDGQVERQLELGDYGMIPGWVTGRLDRSPFNRFPNAVPAACALLAALAIFRSREGKRP